MRLKEGIQISNLNKYSDMLTTSQLDKINDKWDCLTISDKHIQLTKNGFLFVDEISSDLFY